MQDRGKLSYRSGTSYARGILIDGWLTAEEREKLYERWKSEWPEPKTVQGGVTIITCEMVKQVTPSMLNRTYGKRLGTRLLEIAQRHAVLS
jgi:hypothetical protein